MTSKLVTPFTKQCFVTIGVTLNIMGNGLVMGFSAILFPQLRNENSHIKIDDSSGSWIASVVAFAFIVGNFSVISLMSKAGRRTANIVGITAMLIGWLCITLATNVAWLLFARCLQGLSMGIGTVLAPVFIGEYTSPKNRGLFLMTITVGISFGVLFVHLLGSFVSWQMVALICSIVSFLDLLIVIYSPESPSWLASQSRYEECRRVFIWLRGDTEMAELHQMIGASAEENERRKLYSGQSLGKQLTYFKNTMMKKEVFKPIILMLHMNAISMWAGSNILSAYTFDIFHLVIGTNINVALMIFTIDLQRLISNTCALYVIRKLQRRTMTFITCSINIIALLSIAGYVFAKNRGVIDQPILGVALIHLMMFSIATGTIPLPMIIAGEVFPMEVRSLAGGLSSLSTSINLFFNVKTAPFLFKAIGLNGSFCLYASIVGYCLLVAWFLLPETKDKTLQDIEDEFKGKPKELKATEMTLLKTILNDDEKYY